MMDVAKKMGLYKIIINHPFRPEGPSLNLEQKKSLITRGAILEQLYLPFFKKEKSFAPHNIADWLKSYRK